MGLLSALLALAGCGQAGLDRLVAGQSTEADVRAALGTPEIVREEDNGARRLEYPQGPEGQRTYFVWLDANGRFVRYEQVLRAEVFARVQAGMREDEVRALLGRPTQVERFALRPDETVWSWRWLQDDREPTVFSVYFDAAGTVRRTGNIPDPRFLGGG